MSSGNVSKASLWTGWVLSALPALLLIMSAVMKISRHPKIVEGFVALGIPTELIVPIGIIELCCAVIYLIPGTSVLGAILVTGYLGGATLTNLRVHKADFVLTVLTGMVAWLGLYLRDRRVRALIPFRR
jgi:hypothetical protein